MKKITKQKIKINIITLISILIMLGLYLLKLDTYIFLSLLLGIWLANLFIIGKIFNEK